MIKHIKHFKKWIVKSIQYSIFLLDDNDWDYEYILLLLKYKLKRTRSCINKNKIIQNYKKVCAEIEIAEHMLETILKCDYVEKELIAHNKKWGESKHVSFAILGSKYSEMRTVRQNVRNDKDAKQERLEFKKIMEIEQSRSEQAWSAFFDYLKTHMRNWWD